MNNQPSIFVLIILLMLSGCRADKPQGSEPIGRGSNQVHASASQRVNRSEVQAAYERARASMLSEKQVYVDVLWVLTQFMKDDPELDAFIREAKKNVPDRAYVPGVFPDLPRTELPDHPGTGISKFITYLQAAFGQPEDRAMKYLSDYTGEVCNGYILTHQFLSLVWAEQAGLPVTDNMLSRRQELWKKVYEEQLAAERVDSGDLYMERVAIVLAYGRPRDVDRDLVGRWVATMLDLQLDDGSWPLSKTRIHYDGVSTLLSSPRAHTTALAMMTLDAYLHRGF